MQTAGTLTKKNNFLSQFGVACIGEDCCPDSSGLVYDPVKNRCIAKEVFSGNDGGFNPLSNYSIVEPYVTKEQMTGQSLNYSSTTAFNRPLNSI